jgi:hypothetical protein
MSELNEDGLIPGQPVDFETLVRIENKRKNAPAPQPEVARRGRPAKAADANPLAAVASVHGAVSEAPAKEA